MRFTVLMVAILLQAVVVTPGIAQRGGFGGGDMGMGPVRFDAPDLPGPELDGPPDSATARRIMSLSDEQARAYTQAYDSFMAATRSTRDSARAQMRIMDDKLDQGDRAAATFYAQRAMRLAKVLKERQEDFEDRLGKTVSGDQEKAYKKWKKETEEVAKERAEEAALAWQGGGGPLIDRSMRAAAPERKTIVNVEEAAGLEGASDAVRAAGAVYVSGQLGVDSAGQLAGADLPAQAKKAFENLARVLRASRAQPRDVVRLTVYVVGDQPEYLAAIRQAGAEFFSTGQEPALTLVGVQSLHHPGALIAVDAIAVPSALR